MDIGGRILERIADAGLCAEMDDPVDPAAGKRSGERVGVAKIDIDKGEQLTIAGLEMSDARALEFERIIGREIVYSDHGFPATEQSRRDVHSDEPGRAGDKRRQISSPRRPPSFVARSKPVGRFTGKRVLFRAIFGPSMTNFTHGLSGFDEKLKIVEIW